MFFPKKPKFRTHLKNFIISVAFYGKFAIIWWFKNFKFRIVRSGHSARTVGKLTLKKISRWVDDFSSIFKYGRKIINTGWYFLIYMWDPNIRTWCWVDCMYAGGGWRRGISRQPRNPRSIKNKKFSSKRIQNGKILIVISYFKIKAKLVFRICKA